MKAKQVIVTGGAGFIGSHLVDALIKLGCKVTIYDNLSTGKKEYINIHAKLIKVDLSLPIKFPPADFIFHLAALPRIQRSFDQPLATHHANVTATLNVLHAAVAVKAKRFIYSSSSSVYGKLKSSDLPVKESHPPRPTSPYAAQKLMSEIYCQTLGKLYNLDTVILRYFNVYGPRQPTTGVYKLVIPIFLKQKSRGKPLTIFGDGKQTRDFTHVRDVVNASTKAMNLNKKLNGQIINIGSGTPTSILEIANLIGGNKRFIHPNPRAAWEERYKYADISKAKKLLNWQPKTNIKQGIQELIQEIQ